MKNAKTKMVSKVLFIAAMSIVLLLSGCSKKEENTVTILTSAEDYRIEYMRERLKEEFPDYDIVIEYKDTGSHAAKIAAEGKETSVDIVYDLEYAYLSRFAAEGLLADISEYDLSVFDPEIMESNYYIPELRNGGAIIINPEVLAEKNLEVPKSYADLLKPEYKGLISMPNPKSSGTGYMFLKALVNIMGEDEAFAYFDQLAMNILAFTSSGSGPVNALKNKEVAIGLGMTAQAVTAINEGANLDIIFFEEGSPYSMYGQAIISGKETRECVKKVFDFMINTYAKENNDLFYPEQIFADYAPVIENYPSGIVYSDMSGNTTEEKERLLDKWAH